MTGSTGPKWQKLHPGSLVTLEVTVHEHRPGPNRRVPYRVMCSDDTAELMLVFFNPHADWLKKQLPEGEKRIISGKLEHYNGKAQITHPDYMVDPNSPEDMPLLETIYPLTAGVSGKVLRKAIAGAVASVPELPEWHDESLMKREDWPDFMTALERMHKPENADDLEPSQ